ncbi:hypothetical protein POM88_007966 [Heracleum sosnowskyi]|uniref:Uncharacterized protein n=1 Tax=Heracleum sosnowskyi TaxID=360622 RepID=A0AAD8N827_9APIA|nr:hypothetical protein POM88_007966 [Heracleum sosnowskyi]
MLQWMGGSRRKVTASRKSTYKRQKQYFEQRKQHQQQESAWKDGSSDIINTCTQRPINSQSLDILSLQNLNTVAQEHRSTCQNAEESLDGEVLTLDCRTTPELPKMHTSEVASADPTKCRGESYQWKIVEPERALLNFLGSDYKYLSASGKVEQLEMPHDLQLSVLGLLGDDGPNNNLEGNSPHEAHVAFSVEGLGKVEMRTPVHSPRRPVRDFPYGCSPSSRGTENAHSVKKFMSRQNDLAAEVMQDYMSEDDDILYHESKLPPRSMMDFFNYSEHEKVTGKGRLQIIDKGSYLKNGVGNEYIFNNEYENDNMWTERSALPEYDFLFKSKCHSSWKTGPYQTNSNSPDYFNLENHVENDFAFQCASINTNRACTKGMGTFEMFDPDTPCAKHKSDFTNSKGTWYPDLGRTSFVRSVINQPAWSCFETEDERENFSFLSEDSCSCNSVWYKADDSSPLDLLRKKMRAHGTEYCCPVRKKDVKNKYSHGLHCTKQENLQHRDYIRESGYCPAPTTSFQKRKGPHKNWLFEDDVIGSRNSGLGSFCHTSGSEESQPSSFEHWNEDLYNVDSVPEIQVDAKLFPESSRGDFQAKHSPFCMEKLKCCEPNDRKHSSETSFLPKTSSRSGMSTLSPVFGVGGNSRYSFRGIVCEGDIPLCERFCPNGEKELEVSEPNSDKSELQEDACDGSNCLSSENKNIGDALDAGDSCSHFNVTKDMSQEMEGGRGTCSPEQAEYASSIKGLEAPDSIESDVEGKTKEDNLKSSYQKNVQTHPSQNRDIEESGPKERNMESKKQTSITGSSSQGMVLESYAIQLLSVHVLKEALTGGLGTRKTDDSCQN